MPVLSPFNAPLNSNRLMGWVYRPTVDDPRTGFVEMTREELAAGIAADRMQDAYIGLLRFKHIEAAAAPPPDPEEPEPEPDPKREPADADPNAPPPPAGEPGQPVPAEPVPTAPPAPAPAVQTRAPLARRTTRRAA